MQDHATGTVRAYTDAHGEVVKQYRFDSFGNYLNQDTFSLATNLGLFRGFDLRLGHHGLFGERMDDHTNAPMLDASPDLEVWYQSRSRWYVPEMGRFISSDPNATGVPVVSTLAMLGQMPQGPPSGSFDAMSHYGDGWDTWTAYGANPIMSQDPTGLFILGFFSGASLQTEMSSDYSDEVLSTGLDAGLFGVNTLQAAANAQLTLVIAIMDPKISSQMLSGINAAGQFTPNSSTRYIQHHIASNKHTSKWTAQFEDLFSGTDFKLNDPANVMPVPENFHRGRHPADYHEAVYQRIQQDLDAAKRRGVKGETELGNVIRGTMGDLRTRINSNPYILHDTINRKPTGFKGKRATIFGVLK